MKIVIYRVSPSAIKCPFDVEIVVADSFDQAVSLLDKSVDAIVCSPKSNKSSKWFKTVRTIAPKVSFIWFSSLAQDEVCDDSYFTDQRPNQFVPIMEGSDALSLAIQAALEIPDTVEKKSYTKTSIDGVLQVNTVPCDVYLQLSEDKLVKVISSNQAYSTDMLERLKRKGVRYLLVDSECSEVASAFIAQSLRSSLEVSRSKGGREHLEGLSESLSCVREVLTTFGVNDETQALLDDINSDCINTIAACPTLRSYIESFIDQKSYLQGHSIMCSYVAGLIAVEMGWKAEATLQKLSFAAIMHDISLHSDEEALVSDYRPNEVSELNWRVADRVRNHPELSKKLVEELHFDLSSAGEIILDHHLDHTTNCDNVGPLSATFIIAEAFAKRIYGKAITPNLLSQVVDELEKEYDVGVFSGPLGRLIYIASHTFVD